MDPRIKGIEIKLSDVSRIIPVVSGKGGVGKSMISTTLALALSRMGYSVGLLDLDFHGASDHIILGFHPEGFPEEEKGVIPPLIHGIKFMSIVFYTENRAIPLRGREISDALVEILSITRWDSLDYLIVDMPPGLGEQFLDLLRYIPRGEYLLVATPSPLSANVASKVLDILREGGYSILGLVENMGNGTLKEFSNNAGVNYLGNIGFHPTLDSIIGEPEKLLASEFGREVKSIADKIADITGL